MVRGQKYKLILFKSTFYHEFNAFYRIRKFQPVLKLWSHKFLEFDPFWAQKWLFFCAIKPEIFDFRWPNLLKYNIPVRFNDQKKNIPFFQGQKVGKCGFFFCQIWCFIGQNFISRKSLRIWGKLCKSCQIWLGPYTGLVLKTCQQPFLDILIFSLFLSHFVQKKQQFWWKIRFFLEKWHYLEKKSKI